MLKQIRKNVFETNSSSTHTIAIAKHLTDENRVENISKYSIYDEFESGEFEFGRISKIENSIGRRIAYAVLVFLNWPKEMVSIEDRRVFYNKIYGIIEKNLKDEPDAPYYDTKGVIIANVMKLIQFCEWSSYDSLKMYEPTYTIENELISRDHYAYIDHALFAKDFYKRITTDDSALERFIMAENSFVYTGGDEDNGYYMPRVGFEYDYDDENEFFETAKTMAEKLDIEIFFKGN